MAKKIKNKNTAEKAEASAPAFDFEYGDLSVVCSCGRIQTLHKGIEKGLQVVLTNRKDSYIQLLCDECNADIKLCLLEGVKPEPVENTEPETKTDEVVQEESKQE